MGYSENKNHFEELYDVQFLDSDFALLEKKHPKNRVLARRNRIKNLAFEVLWELLKIASIKEIKDNRGCDTAIDNSNQEQKQLKEVQAQPPKNSETQDKKKSKEKSSHPKKNTPK